MENKVKFGINNLHYATITRADDGTPTYATPTREKGAVSITLEPNTETTKVAADDDPNYVVVESDSGYTGTLSVQILSDNFKKDVLGWIEDSNGVLIEPVIFEKTEFALLCEFKGDAHKTRHCFYRCMATKPTIASKTVEEGGLEVQQDEISVIIAPETYTTPNYTKASVNADNTQYDTWYTTVYTPQIAADTE